MSFRCHMLTAIAALEAALAMAQPTIGAPACRRQSLQWHRAWCITARGMS